jgi:peroxiredoxin
MLTKTKIIFSVWCCMLIIGLFPNTARSGEGLAAGSNLPEFKLNALESKKEIKYLGAVTAQPFSVKDLDCQLIVLEIIGVYCPQCHIQHPLFNKLFHRIRKDSEISEKVKMFSIAAGGNPTEIAYVKKEYRIPFPIIEDPKFEIHKLLGEPRTPFTMLVTKEGKIAFAHLGVVPDIDKFFGQIKKLAQ